ncbi:helix-turn-helix domain-containing protein [Lactiplantibacillus pentosus]
MINGVIIKNKRKQLGMSQKELAKGITNQTTISLLENENKSPSMKVLVELSKRLHLDLNIITGITSYSQVENKFISIERLIQNYEYANALQELQTFKKTSAGLFSSKDNLKYDCFYAVCKMWVTEDWDNAIFDFNRLIVRTIQHNDSSDIISVLATVETGVAYYNKGETEKQAYFFTNAQSEVQRILPTSDNIYWMLFIIYNIANFHSKKNDFSQSKQLSNLGLTIAKRFSTSLFVENFYYLIAFGQEQLPSCKKKALYLFYQAKSFATFNNNKLILDHIEKHISVLESE